MKFRKKPVVIEAIQWTGNAGEVYEFIVQKNPSTSFGISLVSKTVEIDTLEGTMTASLGDWIICGIKGEIYPCKPDIFEQTYERAE